MYSKQHTKAYMKSIFRFFFKIFIILSLIVITAAIVLKTDVFNSYEWIKNIKQNTNDSINSYVNNKKEEVITYSKNKKDEAIKSTLDTLGYDPKQDKKETPKESVEMVNPSPLSEKKVEVKSEVSDKVKLEEDKKEIKSEFSHLSIPFYYDHNGAPQNTTKSEVLALINKASNTWSEKCNISFDYVGDMASDYIDKENTTENTEGIIKWEKVSGILGQAHQGNIESYAQGFVMILNPQYFLNKNKSENDLYSTILHEAGHVIGLPHSQDKTSIMYSNKQNRPQVLNEVDGKMCKYYRARWEGMSAKNASKKYGVLVNERMVTEEE